MEYFHHRQQVAEIRRSLADERHINEVIFTSALQSAALEYVPRAEIRTYGDAYARLAAVSEESAAELPAVIRAKSFMLQMTDPATIISEQSIQAYALVSDVVTTLYLMGIGERNIARLYGDFQSSPTDTELYALIPPVSGQQDIEAVREIAAPMIAIDRHSDCCRVPRRQPIQSRTLTTRTTGATIAGATMFCINNIS